MEAFHQFPYLERPYVARNSTELIMKVLTQSPELLLSVATYVDVFVENTSTSI